MTTPVQKPQSTEPPAGRDAAGTRGQSGPDAKSGTPNSRHDAIDPQIAALSQLLRIEAEARQTQTEAALSHLIANETRNLVRARQAFVARRKSKNAYRIGTISSLALVDQNAPLVQWVGRLLRGLAKARGRAP